MALIIREYDPTQDQAGAEEVDRVCEVGPSGTMSLFTDHLGDPLARIRNSPAYLMLVRVFFVFFLSFQFSHFYYHFYLEKFLTQCILLLVCNLGCRNNRSDEADCRAGTRQRQDGHLRKKDSPRYQNQCPGLHQGGLHSRLARMPFAPVCETTCKSTCSLIVT